MCVSGSRLVELRRPDVWTTDGCISLHCWWREEQSIWDIQVRKVLSLRVRNGKIWESLTGFKPITSQKMNWSYMYSTTQRLVDSIIIRITHQVRGQDSWISAKFFFCIFINRDLKKKQGQYSAVLNKWAWSIKDLFYGQKENVFLRDLHRKLWVGKMDPSFPLGWPIRMQDYGHLVRSQIRPYYSKLGSYVHIICILLKSAMTV